MLLYGKEKNMSYAVNETYNTLEVAFQNKNTVKALVRVSFDDDTRVRIGTIERIVSNEEHAKKAGYVTFALEDGSYRTARLYDVLSVTPF
jgi:hypothetical protein